MNATAVTVSTLQDTIRRALDRWPEHAPRIEKAASLLILGHVAPMGPGEHAVRSQATPASLSYAVTAESCACKDRERHPDRACKHMMAVRLLEIAEERQRRLNARESEQAQRARVSADQVALAYAKAIGWAA